MEKDKVYGVEGCIGKREYSRSQAGVGGVDIDGLKLKGLEKTFSMCGWELARSVQHASTHLRMWKNETSRRSADQSHGKDFFNQSGSVD
jgi:hypothetical protein